MPGPPIHLCIPDTQVKPGVDTAHLEWIGRYIVDQFAGDNLTIIHLGDHWDMPSLSSYDKGTKAMEGRRYIEDITSGNAGFDLLNEPLAKYNRLRRKKWQPRRVFLLGNHENRISRAIQADAQLDGLLTLDSLNVKAWGWEVHDFLEPVWIDGVGYAHYWYQPNSGRPYSGTNVETRLRTIGHSFTQGHQQGLLYGLRQVGPRTQHGLIAGSCLTPDHRVLTADLRYVQLGDLEVGDKLVSFDEEIHGRRARGYRTGEVQALKFEPAETWRVTLSSGKEFKATADHLWLTRVGGPGSVREGGSYRWWRTDQLRVGTRIPRPLDEWDEIRTFEAGYLAGMYDGEGCYYTRKTTSGYVGQLSLSQRPGVVLDRTVAALKSLVDVDALGHLNSRGVETVRLRGGAPANARMLGQIRPSRLLPKFIPEHLGTLMASTNDVVVSIEPMGVQEILRIDVDAKTMIVEGYPHHNCYLHSETYRGPQAKGEWRGIIVKHQVEQGSYDLMTVSLDFLCRKYEGMRLAEYQAKAA